MAQNAIEQLLARAANEFKSRRPVEAERCCREALRLQPNHPDGNHLLGLTLASTGRAAEALDFMRKAITGAPTRAEFYANFGMALMQLGRVDHSITAFQQAILLRPDHAPTHNNLGAVLAASERMNRAVDEFRAAARLNPADHLAQLNLGNAMLGKGCPEEAADAFRRALAIKPDSTIARNQLGVALLGQGKLEEAANEFKQVLTLRPDDAEANNNLGLYHLKRHELDEAAACFDRAIAAHPKYPLALFHLGTAMKAKASLHMAIACFERAIDVNPRFDAAIGRRLFCLHLNPADDPSAILREHREWNQRQAEPLRQHVRPHSNDRVADRPLRIGYFLPKDSPVPSLFSHHDSASFSWRVYSDALRQSDTSRSLAGMSQDEASDLIRRDGIDILVDMAMHLSGGRPMLMARKPAPVQVTGLAYPGTMGLWSMDYRLTDPYLDPPGNNDENYSETSIRLPETFFHYEPLTIREALTASDHSRITFACLGEFERVNDLTLDLWKRILEAVPDSRLILLAGRGDHRAKTIAKLGVASARVDFLEPPGRQQYLNLHDQIDVRLDTFPYNGQMSSLDSWWMGVPVVSLCGRTAVSRCGFSIASNLGLANLAAHTPDDYVRIAKELAADSSVRSSLRRRMSESPMMDGPKMIRNLEDAYRTMWRKWCESK